MAAPSHTHPHGHAAAPSPAAAAAAAVAAAATRAAAHDPGSPSTSTRRSPALGASSGSGSGGSSTGAAPALAIVSELRSFVEAEAASHHVDPGLLEPWEYILNVPGKDVRGKLIKCFQQWLRVDEEKLALISGIIRDLHTASLVIDDIEDGSKLRRGVPVAHSIFGTPFCINTANYVYFLALEKTLKLGDPRAVNVFCDEMLNLHRGQGNDIMWRERGQCPTEEQYKRMVLDKTGGLFRLAIRLMQVFSDNEDDMIPLVDALALYFQIRDDYCNLATASYMHNKSFCEDFTEGKFSFLTIFTIKGNPDDHRLLDILKQRTENVDLKLFALHVLRQSGAFEYTRKVLYQLKEEVLHYIQKLGGHAQLTELILQLDAQIDDSAESEVAGAPAPPPAAPLPTSRPIVVQNTATPPPPPVQLYRAVSGTPGATIERRRLDSL